MKSYKTKASGTTSAVEEYIKHKEFQPEIYDVKQEPKTQGMPQFIRTGNKSTAHDLYERACIDIVIEKKVDNGKFSPAVYIRPLEKNISDLLKNTNAKDVKSFEKDMTHIEVNDIFVRKAPNYNARFVFKEFIFWYSYGNEEYSRLLEIAKSL